MQLYNHGDFTDVGVMEAVPFLVPPLPPSTLSFCGIMDISYQIQVTLKKNKRFIVKPVGDSEIQSDCSFPRPGEMARRSTGSSRVRFLLLLITYIAVIDA